MADGFVDIRVESRARRLDIFHAIAAQKILELLAHHLEPLHDSGGVRGRFGRAEAEFQIVEDGQQIFDERRIGVADGVLLFAHDALPVVVEFGAGTQCGVLVFFHLGQQRFGIGRGGRGGFRGGLFVS